MHLSRKITILSTSLLLLLIAIPLTISLLPNRQDPRTKAAAGTSLSLIPKPGPSSSIQKNIGDDVFIDAKVDPGPNSVAVVRMQVQYNPNLLEAYPSDEIFVAYNTVTGHFSTTTPPIINTNTGSGAATISVVVSTGSDPNYAVRAPTDVGMFRFKAKAATEVDKPTDVFFTTETKAFSVGGADGSRENILTTTNPAHITISGDAPPPTVNGTKLTFVVQLHGVGKAGDTPNPAGNSLSNKSPKHPERQLYVEVFDANDQLVTDGTGTIKYATTSENSEEVGTFKGIISLATVVDDGKYTIKVKADRYLRKAFPGTITLSGVGTNILPEIALVAGDTDGDNVLNIIDYNALLDCGYGSLNPLPLTNSNAEYNTTACKTHEPRINIDLEDNGSVNAYDYNLFVRELSVQTGD